MSEGSSGDSGGSSWSGDAGGGWSGDAVKGWSGEAGGSSSDQGAGAYGTPYPVSPADQYPGQLHQGHQQGQYPGQYPDPAGQYPGANPQYGAPQYGSAQFGAPQYGSPQYGPPQPLGGYAPPGSAPQYAYGYGYGQPRPGPSGSAIALTIVSGVLCVSCYFSLAGLPGLILGIIALTRADSDPQGSARYVKIGWITLGVVFVLILLGFIALGIAIGFSDLQPGGSTDVSNDSI